MENEIIAESENISKITDEYIEYSYYNENNEIVYKSKIIDKKNNMIIIYPHTLGDDNIARAKKVSEIIFKGWDKIEAIPTSLRSGNNIRVTAGNIKHVIKFLHEKYPNFEKLVIEKNGKTKFYDKTINFNWIDLEKIIKEVGREVRIFERRRKNTIIKELSLLNKSYSYNKLILQKGMTTDFFSLYDNPKFSDSDIDTLMNFITLDTKSKISITNNFIKSKDKINVAYLEDVILGFEKLLSATTKNEKNWQSFFEKHGWIMNNLFPYQVILNNREAYVGGKTISDANGRYVDFLFQNGFKDNYALIEIKTHITTLLKNTPYRKPSAYSMDEELSGSISQCLDQKNTFLSEFGNRYNILDPKVILIIGQKKNLNENQIECFELIRNNQNSVDIVTFDELLQKIKSLKEILNTK